MQAMMKQLGIKQEDIEAERVIIEKPDGNIIIENPQITKVNMQGQETFQITGNIKEEDNTEQDIQQIIEKTGKNKEEAEKALNEANGDLAEAILSLN